MTIKNVFLSTPLIIMNRFFLVYWLVFFNTLVLYGQYDKAVVAPLDIPFSLSGTFGEPRATHFHLGLDIRTQGKEGWEVKSIAKGHVSRIRVALSGYGKVLYIDHPNQTTTVYAHLKKFAPKIESYIKKLQYENETYTIQKFPKRGSLTIEAGEVIGFSGNTGGSSGPHLHFEIRETKSQKPLNPLLFNFPVEDKNRPQLQKLFIFYPEEGRILPHIEPIDLKRENDSLYVTSPIETSGKIGLGIQMFDRQDLSYNRNGIYSAKVMINGKLISHYEFDEVKIGESKKLYIVVDYKNYFQNRQRIVKLFYPEADKLEFMKSLTDQGIFNIELGKSYQILIEIADFSGNKSIIETYVEGMKKNTKAETLGGELIKPDRDYLFNLDNQEIYFPKKTFLNPVKIKIDKNEDGIEIGPNFFPIANPYEINFSFDEKDSLVRAQTFIAKKLKKSLIYLPTTLKESELNTKVKELGAFTLGRDSISPTVKPYNFKAEQWLSKFKFLNLKIDDDFSGIKSYRGTINGNWVLFEYEPKKKMLTYDFSDKYFEKNKHELQLEVEDNVGNKTVYKTTFFRKYEE